jgi:hypothetical protein
VGTSIRISDDRVRAVKAAGLRANWDHFCFSRKAEVIRAA